MYYHIWFVTKRRKTVLNDEIEQKVKSVFLEVAKNKGYNILEMETNKDHVHLLLEAKDKNELAAMVRTLKAVSARKLLQETPHLRVGYSVSEYYRRKPVVDRKPAVSNALPEQPKGFWARRYGWEIVTTNSIEKIRKYIQRQKDIPKT